MKIFRLMVILAALAASKASFAVVLVQTSDPGYYNNNIGTALNLSGTGIDGSTEPFPINNDSSVVFSTAPNLSAANSILGNWLSNPQSLNSNWSATPIAIPNTWAVGTEVAIIYQFNTLSATNVVAQFGVDNGMFAWLDGAYLFGRRDGGGVSLGEYTLSLGDMSAGTHYLQLLLEDHGGSNGYAVNITADTFVPGPPAPVPEPGSLALLGLGFAGLGFGRRKRA